MREANRTSSIGKATGQRSAPGRVKSLGGAVTDTQALREVKPKAEITSIKGFDEIWEKCKRSLHFSIKLCRY